MKLLKSKFAYGLVAVLLCFCVSAYYPAHASPGGHVFKIEKYAFEKVTMPNFDIVYTALHSLANLPAPLPAITVPEARVYPIVKNARKPDNKLYQLIRDKQLKLYIKINSLA